MLGTIPHSLCQSLWREVVISLILVSRIFCMEDEELRKVFSSCLQTLLDQGSIYLRILEVQFWAHWSEHFELSPQLIASESHAPRPQALLPHHKILWEKIPELVSKCSWMWYTCRPVFFLAPFGLVSHSACVTEKVNRNTVGINRTFVLFHERVVLPGFLSEFCKWASKPELVEF